MFKPRSLVLALITATAAAAATDLLWVSKIFSAIYNSYFETIFCLNILTAIIDPIRINKSEKAVTIPITVKYRA